MDTKRWIAAAAMVGWTLMLSAGCTAAVDSDPTPVTHFKITPASGTQARATATSAATPSPRETAGGAGGEVTLSTKNSSLKFDQTSLSASAGPVTIAFDNQDGGVPHNVHVFEGADAKGKSAGASPLEAGPLKQVLRLNLTAGGYYYRCDAHPTTMTGTLAVR